jgi:hypothetical protein
LAAAARSLSRLVPDDERSVSLCCWLLDGVQDERSQPRDLSLLNPGRIRVKLDKSRFPYTPMRRSASYMRGRDPVDGRPASGAADQDVVVSSGNLESAKREYDRQLCADVEAEASYGMEG